MLKGVIGMKAIAVCIIILAAILITGCMSNYKSIIPPRFDALGWESNPRLPAGRRVFYSLNY